MRNVSNYKLLARLLVEAVGGALLITAFLALLVVVPVMLTGVFS